MTQKVSTIRRRNRYLRNTLIFFQLWCDFFQHQLSLFSEQFAFGGLTQQICHIKSTKILWKVLGERLYINLPRLSEPCSSLLMTLSKFVLCSHWKGKLHPYKTNKSWLHTYEIYGLGAGFLDPLQRKCHVSSSVGGFMGMRVWSHRTPYSLLQ